MRLPRILLPALSFAMMTAVAYAADPPAQCGPMGFLSQEERIMYFADMHQQTGDMNDEQRHAFRQQQREKFAAMPEAGRKSFAAGLKAKWDALPADKQAELRQQAEERRARHPERSNHGC